MAGRNVGLAAVIVAGGALCLAQAPPAAEPAATIRAESTEVVLEVAVKDQRGRPVKNLKPRDLEVYENGVRQEIKGFRAAGREKVRAKSSPAAAAARRGEAPAAHPLRAVNLLCVVFHSVDPASRVRATKAAEELFKEELAPGVYAGVFLLDDHIVPVAPFSSRREDAIQAVRQAFSGRMVDFDMASEAVLTASPNQFTVSTMIDGAGRTTTAAVTARVTGGEVSRMAVASADVSTGAGANALRGDRARERVDFANISGRRATDQIQTMITRLAPLPGRKAVVLVSNGLLTTGDPDLYDALAAQAKAAGITIYSLDPTELNETTDSQAANIALAQVAAVSRTQTQIDRAGSSSAGAARNRSRQGDALDVAVRASDRLAALRAVAESTGGFLIANTTEFDKPFQKIFEEMETHYEVSYRPAGLKWDGRLRTIEVKTAHKDWTVESRRGYFALPRFKADEALEPYEVVALAALGRQPQPAPFEFSTAVYAFGGDSGGRQVALAFETAGANITVQKDEARSLARARLSLLALVKNSNGEVVDVYSQDSPYEFALGNLPLMQASAITQAHSLRLPPGRYSVEAAMVDGEGRRASAKTVEFDVPEKAGGLGLSTPMLVQRVEEGAAADDGDPLVYQGKRVTPLVTAALPETVKPFVYFAVYPQAGSSAKPVVRVDFLVNGKVLASEEAELPPPDASGRVPMLVAPAERPGLCEVRISAVQGASKAVGSVRYMARAR